MDRRRQKPVGCDAIILPAGIVIFFTPGPNDGVKPMDDSRPVYSTETGRICPKCGRPQTKCVCKKGKSYPERTKAADGVIRIKRETKGRKGKTVTTISGFQESETELRRIASELKNRCGTGGSVNNGTILIQGDHREAAMAELTNQGFTVKLAGG
jgi:translation initiation factor 1